MSKFASRKVYHRPRRQSSHFWVRDRAKSSTESLNCALAFHDAAGFDALDCKPSAMVLPQGMGGMAQWQLEQPVEQEVESKGICWAKDERDRRGNGQFRKTGTKLQEEH